MEVLFPAIIIGVLASAASMAAAVSCDGELLFNNICLPAEWPPRDQPACMAVTPTAPYLTTPPATVDISLGRQLFIDDFLIAEANASAGIARAYHAPQYAESVNPVLAPTKPWETWTEGVKGGYSGFASAFSGGIWWDPASSEYRLYYRCGAAICLATSDDGVGWAKPALDAGCDGCNGTNVVSTPARYAGGLDGFTTWLDLDAANQTERWKMAVVPSGSHYTLLTSPNGVHWDDSAKVTTGHVDDRSTVWKNSFRDKWVFSIKSGGDGPGCGGRTRKYWEGDDFMKDCHWKTDTGTRPTAKGVPVNWTWADRADPPPVTPRCEDEYTDLYNVDAVSYESVTVGLYSLIIGKRCVPPHPFGRAGEQDLVVAGWSRDGFHFQMPPVTAAAPHRAPFLPMSDAGTGAWNHQNVQSVGGGFLVTDAALTPDGYGPADANDAPPPDALLFYVGARSGTCLGAAQCDPQTMGHNGNATTGLATLRRDGFASLGVAEGSATGEFTTRPLSYGGSNGDRYLFVNVDTAAVGGSVRVEVQDAATGAPLPGYALAASRAVPPGTNSTLFGPLEWAGGRAVLHASAGPVRFRFALAGAGTRLFAFWASSSEVTGASAGYVAAGGRGFGGSRDMRGLGAGD